MRYLALRFRVDLPHDAKCRKRGLRSLRAMKAKGYLGDIAQLIQKQVGE